VAQSCSRIFSRVASPNGLESDVGIGQLVSGNAEEWKPAALLEVDAHDECLFGGVRDEKSVIWPGNNRAGEAVTALGIGSFVDSQLILAEIEHELEGAAGQNSLPQGRRLITLVEPEIFDEVAEGRSRLAVIKAHNKTSM
jgi:hypothetical protein